VRASGNNGRAVILPLLEAIGEVAAAHTRINAHEGKKERSDASVLGRVSGTHAYEGVDASPFVRYCTMWWLVVLVSECGVGTRRPGLWSRRQSTVLGHISAGHTEQ
jgi:hypothetical protein